MKLPACIHGTTIYDADGTEIARCDNPTMARFIVERINDYALQYARGHADAVELVNRQRDHEAACTRQRIEQRQYEQALEEEIQWSLSTFVHAA
jgi:hypothetical protein